METSKEWNYGWVKVSVTYPESKKDLLIYLILMVCVVSAIDSLVRAFL